MEKSTFFFVASPFQKRFLTCRFSLGVDFLFSCSLDEGNQCFLLALYFVFGTEVSQYVGKFFLGGGENLGNEKVRQHPKNAKKDGSIDYTHLYERGTTGTTRENIK